MFEGPLVEKSKDQPLQLANVGSLNPASFDGSFFLRTILSIRFQVSS